MYRCKICGKKYTELAALYNHIESKHRDMIPKDMTVQQYYYYMKTGKMNGNCVMCKKPTSWNHNTGKYNRFCGDEKCKEEYVKIMKSRMVAKYGKTHLLNDPNKQREMLANRSISGVYKWSDGKHETTYTGSYELDFLKTLDGFFDWDPTDISMPSPHTYTYKYEGEDKFYIPDVFIHSLDLEIEIKDGGDNPNNHYKIQAVDKHKEALKDEVMCSQKAFHYIKITNKNYENFFSFLKEIKREFEKHEDEKKIPRIFKIEDIKGTNVKPVKESVDVVEEGNELIDDIQKGLAKFDNFTKVKYSERDMFFSLRYDLAKNNPKEMQEYLSKLIKAAQFEDDLHYVRKMARKADDHYRLKLKKNPDLKDEYEKYYDWFKNGGMDKDIKKKSKKVIKESMEIVEENIFVSTDNIELHLDKFGHSENVMYITGLGGSGKSTIISKYCKEYGANALEFDAVTSALIKGLENLNRNKIHPIIIEYLETQNPNKLDGFSDPNFIPESVKFLDWFESRVKGDKKLYIIEGMQLFICFEPERFIGKPMIIMGTSVSKSMFRSVCRVYKRSEGDVIRTFKFFLKTLKRIPIFLKNDRQLSDMINVLDESYITDTMEESSISIPQMSYYLQNQYEEDMKDYLNTYKKYYNLMLKEQPAAVKHINEDIRKCLIVIDGLADKGVENNLVQFAKDDLGEIVKAAKKGKPVKVIENTEYVEEKFEMDKFLVWLDKPIMKAKNKNIRLYHTTPGWDIIKGMKYKDEYMGIIWDEGDVVAPKGINMGVTPFSEIRYSIYCWDNINYGKHWGLMWTMSLLHSLEKQFLGEKYVIKGTENPCNTNFRIPVFKSKDMSVKDFVKHIMSYKPFYYIYEFEVPTSSLEIGGAGNVKEYTVSEPITILKRHKIYITEQDIYDYCIIINIEEVDPIKYMGRVQNSFTWYATFARKGILRMIANGNKDAYRVGIYELISSGKLKSEEDIKKYSKIINKNIAKQGRLYQADDGKLQTLGLTGYKDFNPEDLLKESYEEFLESYITDTMEESSISIPQMSYYLQNQYEEDMKDYLNTYKKYYNLMLKEQPAAVKHINEDIRKCLIVIDGLADKGIENNLVQFAKDDLGEIVKAAKHGKPVKVIESTEYVEEGKLNDNLDKILMWLEKPKEKYKGGNITLYHAAVDFDKAKSLYGTNMSSWKVGDIISPSSISIAPGATLFSNPRNAIYFWDDKEYAYEWGLFRVLKVLLDECSYLTKHGKCILAGKNHGMSDDDAVKAIMDAINHKKLKKLGLDYFIIYETEVNIHDLEITGIKSINEYTVSKPVTITGKNKIKITEEMIKKHCIFAELGDAFKHVRNKQLDMRYFKNERNPILSPLLKGGKDYFRTDLSGHLEKEFDDPMKELKDNANKYRHMLNRALFKIEWLGIDTNFESTDFVEDMVNIDDSNNDINSITVQDNNVSVSNVVECKLVYNNPNSKQLFSLTDVKSQLIIENSYVVQRDKVGTHCSVSPVYTDLEEENVLEFQLILNEGVDIHTLNSKLSEGVVIASLHKFDDDNFRFIKESCLKLFGVYPKEIKIK